MLAAYCQLARCPHLSVSLTGRVVVLRSPAERMGHRLFSPSTMVHRRYPFRLGSLRPYGVLSVDYHATPSHERPKRFFMTT